MNFDPKHQYGNYDIIPEPNATEEMVAVVKEILQVQIEQFVPEEYRDKVVWVVQPEYLFIDLETYKSYLVTCVGWKVGPVS